MAITRQTVIRGPGSVTRNAVQFFDRDGIKADLMLDSFGVTTSAFGLVDTRLGDITAKISFRPEGRISTALLAALYPYGNPTIGSSLFGATDIPTDIHSMAGTKVTFHATALTKMPGLKLSLSETAFSSAAEITALVKNATEHTAANSLYTVATAAWTGAFDAADIKGGVYIGTWGTGLGAVTLTTADGWTVDFELQLEPQKADSVGTYDIMITGITARARCRPIGISEDTLLGYSNAQGSTALLGGTMRSGKDLVIAATGALTVTLKEVALITSSMEWGNTSLRAGEVEFVAHRTLSTGIPAAMFTVAMTV